MKYIIGTVSVFFSIILAGVLFQGCRFAPSYKDGDTVSASEFEPYDSLSPNYKVHKMAVKTITRDSADIYVIGEGSTHKLLQLLSYPSRRDTMLYAKVKHVKVTGSADIDKVVRVAFKINAKGDSLVESIEQMP